jgi:hypothetical protein
MSAYIAGLNAIVERSRAHNAEQERAAAQAARERLTPLEDRLGRVLATIPVEVQREGLSLSSLQVRPHPGFLKFHRDNVFKG